MSRGVLRRWRVTADPQDGGPSVIVEATTERGARRAARDAGLGYGWRIGTLDVVEIAPEPR